MRILHVTPSYKPAYIYGGPVMSMSRLCESLSALKNVDVKLITTDANGKQNLQQIDLGKETMVDGVSVIYFKRITGDPQHISPSLWRYLFANVHQYDVIHIHSWWNLLSVVAAAICVMKKKKLIISPRGMLSEYIFKTGNSKQKIYFHKAIGKYLLSRSYFHATSHMEYAECKELINGWQGFSIPNILELPATNINKPKNNVFTLGFLSRIDPKKGLPFVFKAIQKLPFPIRFKIAGEGEAEYIKELQVLAAQLGIADKIEWLGWKGREEKFNELMNFDLFVLSSYNENFANVVVEALYMGTPVCISRHVGLSAFVEKNKLGWITDLTAESVQSAISDSYFDVAKRRTIEAAARNVIISEFSEAIVIQQYIDMYKTVLQL